MRDRLRAMRLDTTPLRESRDFRLLFTAVQAEDEERDELGDAEGADREVGAGELVELVGDGDVGDHPAEVEDGAGGEQQPEVARGAQRGDVHAQRAHTVHPGHRASMP